MLSGVEPYELSEETEAAGVLVAQTLAMVRSHLSGGKEK